MASKAEASFSRKVAAEFVGTAALVVCGPGTAAATGVIAASTGVAFSMAQLGVIALAFMMVIVALIYTIGHISGCHINPAVTLALAAAKKAPWSDVPGYLAAQFVGGIAGAFAIWGILGQPGVDAGLGVLSYTPGHAGLVRPGHPVGGVRDHHGRRPGHRRGPQPGPLRRPDDRQRLPRRQGPAVGPGAHVLHRHLRRRSAGRGRVRLHGLG